MHFIGSGVTLAVHIPFSSDFLINGAEAIAIVLPLFRLTLAYLYPTGV